MKTYTSFIEIEKDLKKLELEREIAKEELKIVKHNFEGILEPMNWINSLFKMLSKYGVLLMIKKILK
ncbi:hypothetical protein BW723_08605 [Polaribacter reichenbachii]|uniref:Glutaminyl-tRNA synthetase n=1 Tax=Polaribacter reichenbachii TaxID=996801 RepID=A0A1B8U766_9FLAO|nr:MULTISPECIES: DUF6327 family protein [Polaribacter]APZ46353.1 hypothetical protein BW723_08605 [Polaribacter reichenbachii]AUC20217.1 hypothetical protein BTO17_16635 [Polaribacter reichenbachii]MBU3010581.1 hypothetical protein [Polaribacter vadi]MDO6740392.1 DUF6327 family protein [Polaribacter sp. 1_MG-2023]OBY67692.1 hypothetical protein LPB301_00895 [Polaribacter reichenbachii]